MKIFFSPDHARHAPSAFISRGRLTQCPEVPERAAILLAAAREAGHELATPRPFGTGPVRAIHNAAYLDFLENARHAWKRLPGAGDEMIPNVHPNRHMRTRPRDVIGLAGCYQADTACPIGPGTWEAALASADTALSAADAVMSARGAPCVYALCRPPGHHAFADMAGGFCYLNNTAIAAQHCREQGAAKVAIVDVDVHHGNGTQSLFYARSDVLTVSLHGDPHWYYPFFCGYAEETGVGDGQGFNINLPMARGTRDDAYLDTLQSVLERVRVFAPDVLVVALGLDASAHDGHHPFLGISTDGFKRIGAALGALHLPGVLVQEGGYVSDYLGANLAAALEGYEDA